MSHYFVLFSLKNGLAYEGVFLRDEAETVALRVRVDWLPAERHLLSRTYVENKHQKMGEKGPGKVMRGLE